MSQKLIASAINILRDELSSAMTLTLAGAEADMCSTRIKKLFEYTMAGGKFARSRLALTTFQTLHPTATAEEVHSAAKVSATIELMQTFFLVIDDIMDHSKLRRGKPCWYTLQGVGLNAINDGLLLDCSIDLVVRSAIPQHPKLSTILAAFYETKRKTVIGQMLDSDTYGVNDCTWSRYRQIVEHKTSHYTYLFPMMLGFHLADVTVGISELQPLAYRIGYLFQAHDDYLDCFGEESVTGKSSTDLAEGKCTWITCKALETLAKDPSKLARFKDNFGKPDIENIRAARELVCSTGVDANFRAFLADTQRQLHADVEGYPLKEIHPILHSIVDQVGKAKKVEIEKHEQENVRKVVENR